MHADTIDEALVRRRAPISIATPHTELVDGPGSDWSTTPEKTKKRIAGSIGGFELIDRFRVSQDGTLQMACSWPKNGSPTPSRQLTYHFPAAKHLHANLCRGPMDSGLRIKDGFGHLATDLSGSLTQRTDKWVRVKIKPPGDRLF